MGLAASQIRLLALTSRKADCELGISLDSMKKMSLTREMTELTAKYNSMLNTKQICYYANGKYNKVNYNYLMGYGHDATAITDGGYAVKKKNSMILTDYKGKVVLSDPYAKAIEAVCGAQRDANGRAGTFSASLIPEILGELFPDFSAEDYQTVMNGGDIEYKYDAENTVTGSGKTQGTVVQGTDGEQTAACQRLLDFYLPIFQAAASNGWTTEYNVDMFANDDYVSDALVSGTFQLENVDAYGDYDESGSLTFFCTAGYIEQSTNADAREQITAWYNSEKEIISEKETWIDLDISDLSTELEAIKTEIQALEKIINGEIESTFDWGSG